VAIQYLPYDRIDKIKWDACIGNAANGLIYGYSFYLDAMSKHWDGLVLNDYEAVMPLTWNRKYFISYLYQPPFTPCLGVFGNSVDAILLKSFLDAVPRHFKFWEISLNPQNAFPLNHYNLQYRKNLILPLNKNYETLYAGYRDNIKRNIRKSVQSGNPVRTAIPVEEVIALSKIQLAGFSKISDAELGRFKKLYEFLLAKGQATTYGVYTKLNELMASAVFFYSHGRAYYILVGNHPNSKTNGASHALIDAFIKDHAGKNIILDFEGSDMQRLAFFYSSFRAAEEQYVSLRVNRLPFWLKWTKDKL